MEALRESQFTFETDNPDFRTPAQTAPFDGGEARRAMESDPEYAAVSAALADLAKKYGFRGERMFAVRADCGNAVTVSQSSSMAPKLEPENFRIDSTGWAEKTDPNDVRYLENPEGDAWELLEGEFAGEQHFTWDAAKRETAKAGKRMPTKEEWAELIRSVNPEINSDGGWQDDVLVRETLGLKLAGYRTDSSVAYLNQGTFGDYWTSSPGWPGGCSVGLSSTQVYPADYGNRSYGLSVRCLAD